MSGSHRSDGVFLLQHPAAGAGYTKGACMTDMGATILHLCGLPLPPEFDGVPLTSPGGPQAHAQAASGGGVQTEQSYAPAEERELTERLRDLGYLQ